MQALPYVMPKRYDAQNWAEENLDEDAIRDYIRAKRREGRSVTHMSLLVSAYYRAVLKNPKINYFVMNRRIYKRNHFCFSFVILKTRAVFALAIFLDRHNLLPRSIIELSPFHTSLFVTNLASINTPCIFHHCYEFGTTSVFVCMGRPVPDPLAPEGVRKKIMPMSVVMDERIATGIEYSRFFAELFRNLKHPESLEEPFNSVLAEKAAVK